MEPTTKKPGAIKKLGDFLGVSKFGQGLATSSRIISGITKKNIQEQEATTEQANKILYAAKQEKDLDKRRRLLMIARDLGQNAVDMSASTVDPGLNLSNKEILGSAANIVLNIATPGGFKGGKAAVIGKNALTGAGFGAASGLEKNRSTKGIIGSTIGGGIVGGALGVATVGLKALKDFVSVTTPKWLMDKAVKPTLDEARKSIKLGNETLGDELLKEGVSGSPEKLLKISESKLNTLEDELQKIISSSEVADKRITRDSLAPYIKELSEAKAGTPGLQGDVQRIKNVFDSIPEEMTLQEANVMKRRIYNELRDVSYKLDAKLSTKGKVLKSIARGLKEQIEVSVGGDTVKSINQRLSLYGRLENRIVDQMARSMRNNAFGLTDAILTSGGLATMNPLGVLAGLGAAGVKHAAGSTGFRTGAAQRLSKLRNFGNGKIGKTLEGATKRAVLNTP